jgi:DNA-binding PadR family transcriptional regulator
MLNPWNSKNTPEAGRLLKEFEDAYKLGKLGLWIIIALKHGPKHMADIRSFISESTDDAVSADDRSIYRTLRRFHTSGMLSYIQVSSSRGRSFKVYGLTEVGIAVSNEFLERNVRPLIKLNDVLFM